MRGRLVPCGIRSLAGNTRHKPKRPHDDAGSDQERRHKTLQPLGSMGRHGISFVLAFLLDGGTAGSDNGHESAAAVAVARRGDLHWPYPYPAPDKARGSRIR